jgi:hypothetical protein
VHLVGFIIRNIVRAVKPKACGSSTSLSSCYSILRQYTALTKSAQPSKVQHHTSLKNPKLTAVVSLPPHKYARLASSSGGDAVVLNKTEMLEKSGVCHIKHPRRNPPHSTQFFLCLSSRASGTTHHRKTRKSDSLKLFIPCGFRLQPRRS